MWMYGVMFHLWYLCTTEHILKKVSIHVFALNRIKKKHYILWSNCSNCIMYLGIQQCCINLRDSPAWHLLIWALKILNMLENKIEYCCDDIYNDMHWPSTALLLRRSALHVVFRSSSITCCITFLNNISVIRRKRCNSSTMTWFKGMSINGDCFTPSRLAAGCDLERSAHFLIDVIVRANSWL